MEQDRLPKYSFMIALVLFSYLGFLISKPFLAYIILSFIFYFIFKPLNTKLKTIIKNQVGSSAVMTVFVLLLIIIPGLFFSALLIRQATEIISAFNTGESIEIDNLEQINNFILETAGVDIDIKALLFDSFQKVISFLVDGGGVRIISSVAEVILGVFVMFFCLYYLFKGGGQFFEELKELIPLKKHHKARLFMEAENMLSAVLYGQVITSVIQGLIGGIGLAVFQIPNALFWTFVLIIFCFIPVTGSPMVMIPASLYLFFAGRIPESIVLLIYSLVIVMNVDNFLKPRLIGNKSKVHPVLILIGVLGGLRLFGFIGILIGPIILAFLIIMIRFYSSDILRITKKKQSSG